MAGQYFFDFEPSAAAAAAYSLPKWAFKPENAKNQDYFWLNFYENLFLSPFLTLHYFAFFPPHISNLHLFLYYIIFSILARFCPLLQQEKLLGRLQNHRHHKFTPGLISLTISPKPVSWPFPAVFYWQLSRILKLSIYLHDSKIIHNFWANPSQPWHQNALL